MANPAGLLSRIHSSRHESPIPIPVPTWIRPPFQWSEATLNKAESMIDRFDSMWRSTGTARAGTPDTITAQVQRILKKCLTEYYKHCEGHYDSPDTTQEEFEKLCLYAFSALIFEDRRDWGPIHRVSDLLSTWICMMWLTPFFSMVASMGPPRSLTSLRPADTGEKLADWLGNLFGHQTWFGYRSWRFYATPYITQIQ